MSVAVIDVATYRQLQESAGPEFVGELVDTFLEEAPLMVAAIRAAHATRDSEAFRRHAHSLKSNCNTFGALQLAAQARAIELSGLDAYPAGDTRVLDELERSYAAVVGGLAELRNE
jgi:HPt (histidine-containing phosphotransfer) domain-containing protein